MKGCFPELTYGVISVPVKKVSFWRELWITARATPVLFSTAIDHHIHQSKFDLFWAKALMWAKEPCLVGREYCWMTAVKKGYNNHDWLFYKLMWLHWIAQNWPSQDHHPGKKTCLLRHMYTSTAGNTMFVMVGMNQDKCENFRQYNCWLKLSCLCVLLLTV